MKLTKLECQALLCWAKSAKETDLHDWKECDLPYFRGKNEQFVRKTWNNIIKKLRAGAKK